MTKQDLFTVWCIGQIVFWLFWLFDPDLVEPIRRELLFGLAIAGNLFYLISQCLGSER